MREHAQRTEIKGDNYNLMFRTSFIHRQIILV